MRGVATALPSFGGALDEAEMVARMQRGPPTSAEDYLMRVRWEGEQLPNVLTAAAGSAAAVAAAAAAVSGALAAPTVLSEEERARLPGGRWSAEFLSSFAEHRQYVARWAARRAADESVMPAPGDVPDATDEAGWREYCFGSDRAKGHAPLVSVLVGLDDSTTLAVLDAHVRWLADCERASNARAVWLFGLGARLAKPLSEAARETLQQLVAEGVRMRGAAREPSARALAPSNIIIAIGAFFGIVDSET